MRLSVCKQLTAFQVMDESNTTTKLSVHTCYVRVLRKGNVNGYTLQIKGATLNQKRSETPKIQDKRTSMKDLLWKGNEQKGYNGTKAKEK